MSGVVLLDVYVNIKEVLDVVQCNASMMLYVANNLWTMVCPT